MASRKRKIGYIIFVIILALIVVSFFIRLPYEVMEPGDAHNLDPVINVEGGHEYQQGEFMFMTVRLVQANIYQYALAKVMKYHKIIPLKDLLRPGQNQKEYHMFQLHLMNSAQFEATYLAYKRAGKNPKVLHKGVIVEGLINGMPAEKKLKLGDVIIGVNGKEVKTADDLLNVMKGLAPGKSATLKVKRNDKTIKTKVSVGRFPEKVRKREKKHGVKHPKKYGIGINLIPNISLKVNPPVTFHTEQIGGPSGGLMFTLGIYNRLTKKNWTKGYKIAGTGTMNVVKTNGGEKGVVGPIGGIKEKVVAADKENVEIFFAPKADKNYKHAVEAAKDIGTDMKIVPVKTFQDALDYLKKLKPKGKNVDAEKKAA
ncbi:MAG TPA: SepM family pheromone-processing serine protease [Bacillales bacterium]|nr:SepM family pheromone-processing serine protease [Bacillales bacterium]